MLEMVYELDRFHEVVPRERPDFALRLTSAETPFGVEITQIFPSEPEARLNLVHGYANQLWSGGSHIHKDDVQALQSVRVTITGQDGTVRQENLPAIIAERPTLAAYRGMLAKAIDDKSRRSYDLASLSHCDLIVFDWFTLPFDPEHYTTDRFFDDDVRAALQNAAFREVLLVIRDSDMSGGNDQAITRFHIVPLQQLLAMERMYVTGQMVARTGDKTVDQTAVLNALTIDHVVRVQGFGEAVTFDGRPFLRYRDILVEWSDTGLQVRDPAECTVPVLPKAELAARLKASAEDEVSTGVRDNVFGCGYTRQANPPSTWIRDTPRGVTTARRD